MRWIKSGKVFHNLTWFLRIFRMKYCDSHTINQYLTFEINKKRWLNLDRIFLNYLMKGTCTNMHMIEICSCEKNDSIEIAKTKKPKEILFKIIFLDLCCFWIRWLKVKLLNFNKYLKNKKQYIILIKSHL